MDLSELMVHCLANLVGIGLAIQLLWPRSRMPKSRMPMSDAIAIPPRSSPLIRAT